jgi:O-antigen ligase
MGMSFGRVVRRVTGGADGPLARAWVLLLAVSIVFPAVTSGERLAFTIAGAAMNLRVAFYFLVAAVTGAIAAWLVLRMASRPVWLSLMLAMAAWLILTALVAHQPPVEWVPTVLRFVLYFGTAITCYAFARRLESPEQRSAVARVLPMALLTAAAVPFLAGIVEFVRGTAPMLNGAPRVSGTMPSHPVAFSLVLCVCAVASIGPAVVRGRSKTAIVRWIAIAALVAVVFMTFTRLSIILVVAAGGLIAALLRASPRTRAVRVVASFVIGALVLFLAAPTFQARFTYPQPISSVLNNNGQHGSSSTGGSQGEPDGLGAIDVDSSLAFRIMLTQHGLKYLAESPIFGHGPGSFDRLYQAESGQAGVAAHDDLLSVAVETGLPGLALYLLVLAALAWELLPRRRSRDPDVDALTVSALVVLGAINLGAAIHNPTYFVEIEMPVWLLVGTALGLRARARALQSEPA